MGSVCPEAIDCVECSKTDVCVLVQEGFLVLGNTYMSLPPVFRGSGARGAPIPCVNSTSSSWPREALTACLFLLLLEISCPYFYLPKLGLRGLLHVFNATGLLILSDIRNAHHSCSHKCRKAKDFQL